MTDDNQVLGLITQTLARLEGKVDSGLTGLNSKLDSKADKSDLARLDGRIESAERRVALVERREGERASISEAIREKDQSRTQAANRRLMALCAVLSTLAMVFALIHP